MSAERYEIQIPYARKNIIDVVLFIVITLNMIAFAIMYFMYSTIFAGTAYVAFITSSITWMMFVVKRKHLGTPMVEFSVIASGMLLLFINLSIPLKIIGVLEIVMCFTSFFMFMNLELYIGPAGVSYPSIPRKTANWDEVDSIICKDDVITINLKDNTLLQYVVDDMYFRRFDVPYFNGYCNHMIKRGITTPAAPAVVTNS